MKIDGINLYKPIIESGKLIENFPSHLSPHQDTINHDNSRSFLRSLCEGLVMVVSWLAGFGLIQWLWTGVSCLFKACRCCIFDSSTPAITWERIRLQAQRAFTEAKPYLADSEKIAVFFLTKNQCFKEFIDPNQIEQFYLLLEREKPRLLSSLKQEDAFIHLGLVLLPRKKGREGIHISKSLTATGIQGNKTFLSLSETNDINKIFNMFKEKING